MEKQHAETHKWFQKIKQAPKRGAAFNPPETVWQLALA